MSVSALQFLFGRGNLTFFKLLKPIGQGNFSAAFSKALTMGSVGSAALTTMNAEENWRKGNTSGAEAIATTGAAFFGCIGGSAGPVLSIAYSSVSSYLTLFSLVQRKDDFHAKNPDAQFVPDKLITGSDYVDLVAAPTVTLSQQISKLTGGRAGSFINALNIARSLISADKSHVLALIKSPDANVVFSKEVTPDTLNLQIAAMGDKTANSSTTAVIECGDIK